MNKEVYTDHAIINWVMDHCKILHLGLTDSDGLSYVVPVNYGYHEDVKGNYTIYVHGTDDGQKGKALDEEKVIGFESDGGHEGLTYTPPYAGAFGPAYRSVFGKGQVKKITDNQEKLVALQTMIHHYVRDNPAVIRPDALTKIPVWKIEVQSITAKLHHPTAEWQKVLGIKEQLAQGYHYDNEGNLLSVDKPNAEASKAEDTSDASTGASQHNE